MSNLDINFWDNLKRIFIGSNSWQHIINPILTAIATTMIVEYFAKPRLEARKQRLIRNRVVFDDMIFEFQAIGLALGILQSLDSLTQTQFKEIMKKQELQRILQSICSLLDLIKQVPSSWMVKHRPFCDKFVLFLGYYKAVIKGAPTLSDYVKLSNDAAIIDTYLLANSSIHDQNIPFIKRLFYNFFTAKKSVESLKFDSPRASNIK